ncbi:hypothetical protein DGG96_05590 [Legionella qingyii]|uniref:Uncharacterized protein n=1 Tax=Legionella qingyii TaxID=2184757 RepID=A0A317U786_9GAMM|nr:hypothetical protein [Legionella qingyii]PWY56597.1 hypothetical protein DGG96_05590 [Legionella qingyii]RUR23410.1 hypothetical protein ELY20_07320 [Legionella qingyii]RUR26143.1 hypothetical protein ELY16_08355 [Legionella qingyii]
MKKIVNIICFFMVFLGAVGFSLAIYCSRVFFNNHGLINLIYLQTTTAFLAFLIQAGMRAGLRKEFLCGRQRIVNVVENYIIGIWVFIFPPLSIVSLLVMKNYYFPIISALNAILTLLIGLRLVQKNIVEACFYSVVLFFINFIAGGWCIYADYHSETASNVMIEVCALVIGMFFIKRPSSKLNYSKGMKLFVKISKKYWGMQVSSFLIVFSGYIFSQLILNIAQTQKEIIIIYSDAILISGIFTMILSRVMLLFEQRVVKSGRVEFYLWIIHGALLLLALLSCFVRGGNNNEMGLFFLLLLGLLGGYAIALISSFINENTRNIFLLWMNVIVVFQCIMFLLKYSGIWSDNWLYFVVLVNLFSLSCLLLIIYSFKGTAYIVNAGSNSENY